MAAGQQVEADEVLRHHAVEGEALWGKLEKEASPTFMNQTTNRKLRMGNPLIITLDDIIIHIRKKDAHKNPQFIIHSYL